MSSHERLSGLSSHWFIDQFFSLKNAHSLGHLLTINLVAPLNGPMNEAIKHHSFMVRRVGAPLLAIPSGLARLALGIAYLAEGVFKGLVNLFLAIAAFDKKRTKAAVENMIAGAAIGVTISLYAIVFATLGAVGLIVAPNWTHKNIIAFGAKEENK